MRIIIALMFLSIVSCSEKTKKPEPASINQDKVITMNSISNYDSIVNLVKTKGNTEAYSELFYHLKDSDEASRTDTVMYYSKIMAEKFNNKRAYFDYFEALCEKDNIDFDNYSSIDISSMDASSKEKAEEWLKKMLEKKIITQSEFSSIKK